MYEVEIDKNQILHVGDMEFVDQIGAQFAKLVGGPNYDLVSKLANRYWEGERSEHPVIEFLVKEAKVVKKIKGKSDTKAWVKSQTSARDS